MGDFDKRAFLVIRSKFDDGLCVVPSVWTFTDKNDGKSYFFWPSDGDFMEHLNAGSQPNNSWRKHECTGLAASRTYQGARQKLKAIEEGRVAPKRRRMAPLSHDAIDNSHSSQDESEEVVAEFNFSDQKHDELVSLMRKSLEVMTKVQTDINHLKMQVADIQTTVYDLKAALEARKAAERAATDPSLISGVKRVEQQLRLVKDMVASRPDQGLDEPVDLQLPRRTIDELIQLEKLASDREEVKHCLKKSLVPLVSTTLAISIRNIMQKLATNRVWSSFVYKVSEKSRVNDKLAMMAALPLITNIMVATVIEHSSDKALTLESVIKKMKTYLKNNAFKSKGKSRGAYVEVDAIDTSLLEGIDIEMDMESDVESDAVSIDA